MFTPPNVVCMHKNEFENIFSIGTVLRSLSLSLSLKKKKNPLEHVCVLSSPLIISGKYFPIKKNSYFLLTKPSFYIDQHFLITKHGERFRSKQTHHIITHSLSLSLKQANINILSEYLSKTQQGHSRDVIMIWFQFI